MDSRILQSEEMAQQEGRFAFGFFVSATINAEGPTARNNALHLESVQCQLVVTSDPLEFVNIDAMCVG